MNERDQILKLIEECPRAFSQKIQSNKLLKNWILENTLVDIDRKFAEHIYSALYQDNGICKRGNNRSFLNIYKGFRPGCGPASTCQCVSEIVSAKVVKTKSEFTQEKKEQIQQKTKNTNLHKYGTESPAQNKEIQDKIQQTNIERYGVKSTLQVKEVQDKIKETKLEKYGVDHHMKSEEVLNKKINNKKVENNNNMNERDQILKLIEDNPSYFTKIIQKTEHLLKWVEEHNLRSDDVKLVEKIYSAVYQENGICKNGNSMIFHRFSTGYRGCGYSCKCKVEKTKQNNLEKYGVTSTMKLKEVKDKIKQTNLDRYGTTCSLAAKEIQEKTKQTNLERYGVECHLSNSTIREKIKQTNLEKYGVETPLESDLIKDKIKQTCLDRYGVENTLKSEVIQDRIKQTNLDRYGVEKPFQLDSVQDKCKETMLDRYGVVAVAQLPEFQEKIKQTNLERHGVEYPMQSPVFQEKTKQTLLDKYGVEYTFQSEIIQEKAKQTMLDRYGVENSMMSPEVKEKAKQTMLDRHGVKYALQSEELQEKAKQTNLDRYGVENPMQSLEVQEKAKQTNLDRYGYESCLSSPEIKAKIRQTNLRKYGVENASQSLEVQEKAKQTNLDRYGVEYPAQVPEVWEKIISTNLKRYGRIHYLQCHIPVESLEIINNISKFEEFCQNKQVKEIAEELGVSDSFIYKKIKEYNIIGVLPGKSIWECKIKKLVVEHDINYIQNTRKIITPLELDFYFPDHNFAIEINGMYWHSELLGNKARLYHYDKFVKCQEQRIHLYQYFDDELHNSFDVIKSKILYLTKKLNPITIGARHIKDINEIPFIDTNEFLLKNHIQKIPGKRNVSIGAYYNNQLIAVFVGYLKDNTFLLSRYANDINYSCPGLFSKLLKFFITRYNFKGVITTYSDNRHSNGNLYAQTGFINDNIVLPGYSYTNDYFTRLHCSKFRKEKIQKNFGIDMSNKTEWQAMQELGYDRVWDAGKLRWIKII